MKQKNESSLAWIIQQVSKRENVNSFMILMLSLGVMMGLIKFGEIWILSI